MYSSSLLQRSRKLSDLLRTRIFSRPMGGGPRTFPGGINKWQWKRLHEKKAREKEKRLLEQEKQLYQARIRSQIRAKLAGKPGLQLSQDPGQTSHSPMSPKDHIKALADRFMKEGAEDLWNEDDGPLKSNESRASERPGSVGRPIDLRKLISDKRNLAGNSENVNLMNANNRNYVNSRNYSVQIRSKFRRNESSSSEDDLEFDSKDDPLKQFARNLAGDQGVGTVNYTSNGYHYAKNGDFFVLNQRRFRRNESSSSKDDLNFGLEYDSVKPFTRNLEVKSQNSNSRNMNENVKDRISSVRRGGRFRRNESSSSDDDLDLDSKEENEGMRGGWDVKKFGSAASLGKYDVKITKRVPLNKLEQEIDFSEQVQLIRHELSKKKLAGNEREKSEEESIYSKKRFDDCGISPLTVKALSAAGYVQLTRVQEATLSVCIEGRDTLVKAKSGTGKSAAFLLPAIEAVLKANRSNTIQRVPSIHVLILCPTRELASQIAAEANVMLKYHDGIGMQTLVGGTRFKVDQKRLESDPCQILVATPGRLLDHIENKSGLSVRLMGLKMLIVDEADHLLKLGFRKDVEKIVDCLPRERQSLLFSATIPKEVRRISQLVLKREHSFIDTVGLGCVETHAKVKQSCLVAPHGLHFQIVHHLLKEHILQAPDYKVIVFCTTGMVTSLMYLLLREMKMNVREIHSRKPQLYRTRISDEFRESKRLILVTSDVSTRGMNYPDVTLVIQVGIPSDREEYIHRLGRTGREGKEGEGILLLAPWEKYFLDELQDLPLENFPLPELDAEAKLMMELSMRKIDSSIKDAAYHSWLGYYNSIRRIGRDKTTLVELANQFCESIGLQKPPPLFRKTVLKMGLKDIPGIHIRK